MDLSRYEGLSLEGTRTAPSAPPPAIPTAPRRSVYDRLDFSSQRAVEEQDPVQEKDDSPDNVDTQLEDVGGTPVDRSRSRASSVAADPEAQEILKRAIDKFTRGEPLSFTEQLVTQKFAEQAAGTNPAPVSPEVPKKAAPKRDGPAPDLKGTIDEYRQAVLLWARNHRVDQEDIVPFLFPSLQSQIRKHILNIVGTTEALEEIPLETLLHWIREFLPPPQDESDVRDECDKLALDGTRMIHKFPAFDGLFVKSKAGFQDAEKIHYLTKAIRRDDPNLLKDCKFDNKGQPYEAYWPFRENAFNQVRLRDQLNPHHSSRTSGGRQEDQSKRKDTRDSRPPREVKKSKSGKGDREGKPPRASIMGINPNYIAKLRRRLGDVCIGCLKKGHYADYCPRLLAHPGKQLPALPIPPPEGPP